jgi:hypothetical protein
VLPSLSDTSLSTRLQNELIVRLCYYERETKVAEVDYLVNSIVMTIGIQKDDIQKKLTAMNAYKIKFVESLYFDTHNPRYEKIKKKKEVSDIDIVKKVSGFSGTNTKR